MKALPSIAIAILCIAGHGEHCLAQSAAQDQAPMPGRGNARAIAISRGSAIVRFSVQFLLRQAATIQSKTLKAETIDAIGNPSVCIRHRAGLSMFAKSAILKQLLDSGLAGEKDSHDFSAGLMGGIFPPVLDEGGNCPRLPQPFSAAPGSTFNGHHSYPGGLAVHEANNEISAINLARQYRRLYGADLAPARSQHSPSRGKSPPAKDTAEMFISQDVMVAAPIWHDWAKAIVLQWNADGSEFPELNFAGNGATDNYGNPGDSKTGAHHILGLAETMKRNLPPDLVITQASAHASPTLGNEYKVVNWLRAAAIVAQIDPVSAGYLTLDKEGNLRLPALRRLFSIDLNSASPSQPSLLAEYSLHNLSDSDFTYSAPAVLSAQLILQNLATDFGYDPADVARYNNHFRNVVLSNLTAEHIFLVYSARGIDGVRSELQSLRAGHKI